MNDPRASARAWLEDCLAFGIEDLPRVRLPAREAPQEVEPLEGCDGDPAAHLSPTGSLEGAALLEAIAADVAACTRCRLATTRTKVVPGQGSSAARIMFVGEAPGADEDREGLAFVGRAGQLLTKMIQAMGFTRDDVFIANVLKCRPPENRDPAPDEASACTPFLTRQIDVIRPEILVALGAHAARNLLKVEVSVGRLRGRVHAYQGIPLVVTYHPSYLLRSPQMKGQAWEDLKLVLSHLGLEPPPRPSRSA